uniref:Bromo domain-containing protein n=1 Tax=Globisporangium ultimum (strain ATCC 200006 / CBS 805.95 / DAOM BR144) TaxID=431595 RepID=K3WQ70_GLOUD
MDPEQKKKCSELLEYFFKLDSTEPFRERVNWEEWGLYDYLQVVKIPMDLGTIRNKLSKNEYKKPVEFARDVRLVWDNCKLYNQDGSELYDIADGLSKKFEDRVKAMKLDVGTAPRADKSVPAPSINEKLHFSQNIYKVSTKDLGAIVAILEEKCPKALDKSSTDELDIVIDSIDNKTFRELETFVMERVPEGSREPVTTPKSSKKSSSSSKRSSKEPLSSSASKKSKTSE